MRPLRVALIIGTRPELIKLAPLYRQLRARHFGGRVEPLLVFSGQHKQLVANLLPAFRLRFDWQCSPSAGNVSLGGLYRRLEQQLRHAFLALQPDWVVVQGDTATATVGAVAAWKLSIPIVHVEAGLRTGCFFDPWPEELNRRLIDRLSSLHCAPTVRAKRNLLKEGADADSVHVTGNTGVDALQEALAAVTKVTVPTSICRIAERPFVLITCHRRENLVGPIRQICSAVNRLVAMLSDYRFVWIKHPNPLAQAALRQFLHKDKRLILLEPLEYWLFLWLARRAAVIISDSGGIQEEVPTLGVPLVVARRKTERPEVLESGWAVLAGVGAEQIVRATLGFLERPSHENRRTNYNPFGDGQASQRIAALIAEYGRRFAPQQPAVLPVRQLAYPDL